MKRRITLSIALTVSVVLVSLASSDSTAQAQLEGRRVADTGIVSLGPNEELRLTLMADFNADGKVDAADYVLFRRMEYGQETCGSDGVCKLVVTSQTTTNPIRLRPGEAIHTSSSGGGLPGVRIVALSNHRSVRATATIINTITGETTSHIIVANTDGDIH
jgi:hypothetical protein